MKGLTNLLTDDGKDAYEVLTLKNCPFKLPHARSMTQAKIDFENLEKRVIDWYNSIHTLQSI
jgi:hypothetical protein